MVQSAAGGGCLNAARRRYRGRQIAFAEPRNVGITLPALAGEARFEGGVHGIENQQAHPTLIIAGLLDAATPLEMHEFLPDQISTVEMITMEAAHLSNIEQPAAYTDAVLHFLARVK